MRLILRSFLSLLFVAAAFSQIYTGKEAERKIRNAQVVRMKENYSLPNYVKFQKGKEIAFGDFFTWFKRTFGLKNSEFKLLNSHQDELGYQHFRYMQAIKGYDVKFSMLIVHVKNGLVESFNGVFVPEDNFSKTINVPLSSVRKQVLADYPKASFIGEGKTVWFPKDLGKIGDNSYTLTYEFLVEIPDNYLERANVYYDASSGKLLKYYSLTRDIDSVGTAVTKYSGTHQIVADYTGTDFRLREAGRGNGVETYNANNGSPPSGATDFYDTDNYWNNFNANLDEIAGDAHWGAEMTYDFLYDSLNRNSLDGNGFKLRSYVHVGQNWNNASWNGSFMQYGDGSNGKPFATLDIVGHELTHGLTQFTADLIYYSESGALNESFSDIFGATIEWYALPNSGDWLMGEDMGWAMRDMSNPKSKGDPDTYLGINWFGGTADNAGVHTNSGVQNYWFYLLSDGGSGTNDYGNSYNVSGIGVFKAIKITYRSISTYLFPSADYSDARYYAIIAALDLYGGCSPEVIATTNAWYAVGVGNQYSPTVTADFESSFGINCQTPFTVKFYNKSNNSNNFTWDFGDGTTSSQFNPTHTYNAPGQYTVQLIANGGNCGSDTITKQVVNISSSNPCVYNLGGLINECSGFLFDDGGPINNYSDNQTVTTNFDIPGAVAIKIKFFHFDLEPGYDSLFVYDNYGILGQKIGAFTGTQLPFNGQEIIIPGGKFRITLYADQSVNYSGFGMKWECIMPSDPPIAAFNTSKMSCSSTISFSDTSINSPTAWLWDFGDGTTSSQQNPTHTYNQSGDYLVTLIAQNANGSDTTTQTVKVRIADSIAISSIPNFCDTTAGNLIAQNNGFANTTWFKDPNGYNILKKGDTLAVSNIAGDTTFYIKQEFSATEKVGPKDNTIGSGSYYINSGKGLVFDVYEPCILKSVKVYAIGPGVRAVRLYDNSGAVLNLATANLTSGEHRMDLNFELSPGNDYQLVASASGNLNLYRNSKGGGYPHSLINPANGIEILRIKKANLPDPNDAQDYYYFFYDWEVEYTACETPIQPVEIKDCSTNISYLDNNISLYPNPVYNKLIIDTKVPINKISIYNVLGTQINSYKITYTQSNLMEINLEKVPAGVYLVKITSGKNTYIKKFVVNK